MSSNTPIDPLQIYHKIYEMAKSVNRLRDPIVIRALQTIQTFSNKPELVNREAARVSEYLKPLLFQLEVDPNPFEPVSDENLLYGEILIGREKRFGSDFGLNLNELNEHLLIAGRAGAGKTTLIYIIIAHLIKYGVPFWAFDFKQDFRHIAKVGEVLVFDWQSFRFNPLRPPVGVDPKIWMQAFTNVFCQVYWLLSASKSIILQNVDKLYREYGVFEGSNVFPTILDLRDSLKTHVLPKRGFKEVSFLESAQNRVTECLLSFQDMVDCDQGYSIEDLLDKNVVVELEGLLVENQSFLLTILLRYVFQYRLSNAQRSQLKHVFLFDEAKSAYSKNREFTKELGVSEIAQFTSMIREFGEGLVVADQMPTELADSIKANVYTTICMSQSGGANVEEMSKAMGLTPEQADVCRVLEADKTTGIFEAIVKLNGRWQQPFVIKIAPAQIVKDVSDAELRRLMEPVLEELQQEVIPRTPYQQFLNAKREAEEEQKAEARQARREETKKKEAIEDNILIKILTNIREHPFIDQKTRIEMLNLPSSASTTDKLFKELAKRDLVTVHRIGLGRGKSTRVLYEITEKGRQFASMDKISIPGKGSFKHQFWQHIIKKHYDDLGYNAEIEKRYGSKNVDVGFEQDGKRIAVEVELTPDNLIENIEKDLDAGCDEIIIAVPNQKAIISYNKMLPARDEELVSHLYFRLLSTFLE